MKADSQKSDSFEDSLTNSDFFCCQQRTDGQFRRIREPVGYFKDDFSIIINVNIVIHSRCCLPVIFPSEPKRMYSV